MSDPRPDDVRPQPTPSASPAEPVPGPAGAPADAAVPADPTLERRAFVRRMGTDAVRTAGTVFNLSRMLTRGAVAATQAVASELESLQVGNAADEAVPPPDSVIAPGAPAAAPADTALALAPGASADAVPEPAAPDPVAAAPVVPVAAPPAPAAPDPTPPAAPPPPPSRPALTLDADMRALLDAATTAVVAVNREGHPPQLTTATVLWDGETIRFATFGWARRTGMLRADPRIGLLVEGPGDGRFASVTGRATVAEGRAAHDAMLPLLLRQAGDGGEAAAEDAWTALVAEDPDRAVIVVQPDQVLPGRR